MCNRPGFTHSYVIALRLWRHLLDGLELKRTPSFDVGCIGTRYVERMYEVSEREWHCKDIWVTGAAANKVIRNTLQCKASNEMFATSHCPHCTEPRVETCVVGLTLCGKISGRDPDPAEASYS